MTEPPSGPDDAQPAPDDVGSLTELTDAVLPALIARLRASRMGELEVRSDGWRVRLRREALEPVAADRPDLASSASDDGFVDDRPEGLARSPGVGYFSPDAAISVGSAVRSGDPIGWVDVLGIRQEVGAPVDGVVGRFLAETGQAVEYGQPLALIETDLSIDGVARGPGPAEAGERAAD